MHLLLPTHGPNTSIDTVIGYALIPFGAAVAERLRRYDRILADAQAGDGSVSEISFSCRDVVWLRSDHFLDEDAQPIVNAVGWPAGAAVVPHGTLTEAELDTLDAQDNCDPLVTIDRDRRVWWGTLDDLADVTVQTAPIEFDTLLALARPAAAPTKTGRKR